MMSNKDMNKLVKSGYTFRYWESKGLFSLTDLANYAGQKFKHYFYNAEVKLRLRTFKNKFNKDVIKTSLNAASFDVYDPTSKLPSSLVYSFTNGLLHGTWAPAIVALDFCRWLTVQRPDGFSYLDYGNILSDLSTRKSNPPAKVATVLKDNTVTQIYTELLRVGKTLDEVLTVLRSGQSTQHTPNIRPFASEPAEAPGDLHRKTPRTHFNGKMLPSFLEDPTNMSYGNLRGYTTSAMSTIADWWHGTKLAHGEYRSRLYGSAYADYSDNNNWHVGVNAKAHKEQYGTDSTIKVFEETGRLDVLALQIYNAWGKQQQPVFRGDTTVDPIVDLTPLKPRNAQFVVEGVAICETPNNGSPSAEECKLAASFDGFKERVND